MSKDTPNVASSKGIESSEYGFGTVRSPAVENDDMGKNKLVLDKKRREARERKRKQEIQEKRQAKEEMEKYLRRIKS